MRLREGPTGNALSLSRCRRQTLPDADCHKEHGCLLRHALEGCILTSGRRDDWQMRVHHMPANIPTMIICLASQVDLTPNKSGARATGGTALEESISGYMGRPQKSIHQVQKVVERHYMFWHIT